MSNARTARALRHLGAARRSNLRRVASGKSPVVAGKKVSAKSLGLTKAKAKERLKSPHKKLPKTKAAQGRHK